MREGNERAFRRFPSTICASFLFTFPFATEVYREDWVVSVEALNCDEISKTFIKKYPKDILSLDFWLSRKLLKARDVKMNRFSCSWETIVVRTSNATRRMTISTQQILGGWLRLATPVRKPGNTPGAWGYVSYSFFFLFENDKTRSNVKFIMSITTN